jgi:hypothetical protein
MTEKLDGLRRTSYVQRRKASLDYRGPRHLARVVLVPFTGFLRRGFWNGPRVAKLSGPNFGLSATGLGIWQLRCYLLAPSWKTQDVF